MRAAWDSWTAAWSNGVAMVETMTAAGEVIAARTTLIGAALADPAKGDWAELSRMAPEKLTAFGEAGAAAALDLARLHAESLRLWTTLATLTLAGRPPTLRQTGAMLSRMATTQGHAQAATARALAPVRRRVTANARRLRG